MRIMWRYVLSVKRAIPDAWPAKNTGGKGSTRWTVIRPWIHMTILLTSQTKGIHNPPGIEKKQNKYKLINFISEEMWFNYFLLLSFLPTNNNFPLNLGNIQTPLNDPHSKRGGLISSNQFKSNLYCSCSCFRKPVARSHTINWKM